MDWSVIWREYTASLQLVAWALTLLKMVLIVTGAHLLMRLISAAVDRGIDVTERRLSAEEEIRRAETLRGLAKSVARYVIGFLALTTLLPLVGVPIAQIVAGAGVLGLAVGFGAQHIVRDVISGFFFLYENQFTVGDFVSMGGVSGMVEEMGLRMTRVRSFAGEINYLPNGTIDQVTNYSRGPMRAMVDVDIAYEEKVDEAIEVLEELCDELAEDIPEIVEGPRVLGVQSFNNSSVTLRVWARTQNMQQWTTERLLRRSIKNRLAERGVEIPYPRRVIVPSELTKVGAPDAGDDGREKG